MDEETKRWLEEEAARAEKERCEYFAQAQKESDARRLAKARSVLAKIPPLLPGQARHLVKIFEAPLASQPGETQTIEGMVFECHEVESGHLGGHDNFRVFEVITADGKISSWRYIPGVEPGKAVKIKFIPDGGRRLDGDAVDDTVLELWIEDSKK